MNVDHLMALEEGEYRAKLFRETLSTCSKKSIKYVSKSKYYKFANISFVMIMIVISCVLGVLLAANQQSYALASLSFCITFLQLVHQAFKIGTLGVYYRYAGMQINKLQRRLIRKVRENADVKDIDQLVENINEELDDISMMLFSQSYGPAAANAANQEGDLNMDNKEVEIDRQN